MHPYAASRSDQRRIKTAVPSDVLEQKMIAKGLDPAWLTRPSREGEAFEAIAAAAAASTSSGQGGDHGSGVNALASTANVTVAAATGDAVQAGTRITRSDSAVSSDVEAGTRITRSDSAVSSDVEDMYVARSLLAKQPCAHTHRFAHTQAFAD